MPFTVPGLGYAGLGQMTRASQLVFQRAMGARNGTGSRKRRKRNGVAKARKRASRAASSRRTRKPARMVAGSAAAKRHMAKLRKMRKR